MAGVAIAVTRISSCTSRLALLRACINPFRLESGPVFMILCQREMVVPTVSARPVNCGHWRPGQPYRAPPTSPADLAPQSGARGAAHLREHAAAIGMTFPDDRTPGHDPPVPAAPPDNRLTVLLLYQSGSPSECSDRPHAADFRDRRAFRCQQAIAYSIGLAGGQETGPVR